MPKPVSPPSDAELAAWRSNPVAFCIEGLRVTPEPWQAEALRTVLKRDRVAIRSGHGVGKSAFLAWLILWFLATHRPARIPCTAPTAHQLSDILWGEVAKWSRRARPDVADLFDLKSDRLEYRAAPQECFAIARTARKNQPEAFQGFHSENLLFVVDEASGVEDAIFEVGEGAMSTPGAKAVLAGNPTRRRGYFFDAFHRRRASWATMRVACADSRLVSSGYARDMAERYGADSNVYRVRVLGEFPTAEDDAVIALDLCEAAVRRDAAPITAHRVLWGLDVARFGSDRTALAKRRANVLLEPVKSWQGKDLMQVSGLVSAEYARVAAADAPAEILVDSIGLGAGVVDRLRELRLPVRGINVAEAPSNEARFMRRRDELWWRAREWLEARDCVLPDDAALIAELSAPRYSFTSAGKIQVEAKDEMKSRGVQSPDLADAFCLTFAGGLRRRGPPRRYEKRQERVGSWMSV